MCNDILKLFHTCFSPALNLRCVLSFLFQSKIVWTLSKILLNQIYFRPIEGQVARILSSVLFDFFFTFALLGKKLHLHAIPIGHSINSSSSSHVKVRFLHSNSTWYVSIKVPLGFIVQLTNSSVDFTK